MSEITCWDVNRDVKQTLFLCCRMLCEVCHQDGWHKVWCTQKEVPSTEWPPVMPVHDSGEAWSSEESPWMGGSTLEIPLPSLDIAMVDEEIHQVEGKNTDSDETDGVVSWDLVGEITQDNVDGEESKEKLRAVVGPSTPQDSDGTNNIEKLWVSATNLANALARYVEEEE
jgi:hypothetical protein